MPEVTCFNCNIKIPAENQTCPFCKKPLVFSPEEKPQETDVRKLMVPPESFSAVKEFYRQYGKWLKPAFLVLLAVSVIWVCLLLLAGPSIEIPKDSVFPIKVKKVKDGLRIVLLKGTVINHGEDIHSISLRSLSVKAEFRLNNGRVEKKRIYPTSFFRGDETLLHDESGIFEIEIPPGVKVVTLRAEVVDLGEDRSFRLPMQRKNQSLNITK